MDLRKNIKDGRARQRIKRHREDKVFNTVCTIVRNYGLDEDFLKTIEDLDQDPWQHPVRNLEVRAKQPMEIPPCCMVSAEIYGLVLKIIGRLDNPYLAFARSPEEMVLSARLHRSNPSLDARLLLRHDFRTLLLGLGAGAELAALEARAGGAGGSENEDFEMEIHGGREWGPASPLERIKNLKAFLAEVEQTESQAP
jgi:hypothetical protein